jgi:histidinol-phosphate aminotransferase
MAPAPREDVVTLVPYEPGRPIETVQRELGLERVIKLASNESPWGPFPEALEAMAGAAGDANRYPDGGAYRLKEAIAARHGVSADQVAVGAGVDGIIRALCVAYLNPGDNVVCGWPSFPSYPNFARLMGADAIRVPLAAGIYDPPAIRAAATDRTRLAYLCTPNNPTGGAISQSELRDFLDDPPPGALVVVDEAYHEYARLHRSGDRADAIPLVRDGAPCLVMRSFSKLYALAGARVGYAIGPAEVVRTLEKVRAPFAVSSIAQAGALASLGVDDGRIAARVGATIASLDRLGDALRQIGVPVGPDHANFLHVDLGRPGRPVFEELLREGLIVRPTDGFGAPDAIRVSAGTEEETDVAVDVLSRVLGRHASAGAVA